MIWEQRSSAKQGSVNPTTLCYEVPIASCCGTRTRESESERESEREREREREREMKAGKREQDRTGSGNLIS